MRRVVIDPGHGGKDPGAVGPTGLREADVNLAIAQMVSDILSPVVDVTMIRRGDVTVELADRAPIANRINTDAYVSIHCNAASNKAARGTETYSYPGAPNGKILATSIHRRVVPALGLTDRGLKEANFAVLRETEMAAALVELAFISNPTEEQLLADPAFQRKAATAIAEGIAEYLGVKLPSDVIVLTGDQIKVIDGRSHVQVRMICDLISGLTGVSLVVGWNEQTQSVEIRKG